MADKHDFLPDKPGKGLLSRLHLTRQQRKTLLKWVLYSLLLLALSVLQDVVFSQMRIGGGTTDLVPCGIFLICLAEGVDSGCVFALIASALYLFSGTAPGPYAMVFITFLGILATAFRQGYLQQGFSATMLCTSLALVLYELAVFAIGLFLQLTTGARIGAFVLTALFSILVAPLLYWLVRRIGKIGGQEWKE